MIAFFYPKSFNANFRIEGGLGVDLILTKGDAGQLRDCLDELLKKSGAHTALLIEKSGQLLASAGVTDTRNVESLAALTAANFSATVAIAKIFGEDEFSLLFHKGKKENIHFSNLGEDLILVTVFDNSTSLGVVRLHVQKAMDKIRNLLENKLKQWFDQDIQG